MSEDLFGAAPEYNTAPVPGAPRKRREPKPNGYGGIPGTGPEGKACRDCKHLVRRTPGYRTFLKCGLNRANWTGGRASDIHAKAPACSRFEARPA